MKKLIVLLVIATLFLLGGCATKATHLSLTNSKINLVEMIPLRKFVANRGSNFGYKISPDGEKIAWIAVLGAQTKIHWRYTSSDKVTILDRSSKAGINSFNWAQDSKTLLTHGSYTAGSELTHILSLSIDHPQRHLIDLSPSRNTKTTLLKIPQFDPEHIYVQANKKNKYQFDVYKIHLKSKEMSLVAENPGNVTHWIINEYGQLKGRVKIISDDYERLERYTENASGVKQWSLVDEWSYDDEFGFIGFATEDVAWILSNTGRDKTALFKLNLLNGDRTLIYSDDKVNLERVHISELSLQPIFTSAMPEYPKLHFFNVKDKTEFTELEKRTQGYLRFINSDNEEENIVFSSLSEKHIQHYLYQRKTKKLQLLGSHPLSELRDQLSTTQAISFTSRDGLLINGYLTMPKGLEKEALPMVLRVHGGPWSRDRYGMDPNVQFLANRGYAVLQINFRGSSGYGKNFDLAGVGEFAKKMHTDLIDGVNWAVKKGIADKDKVCIYGHSYGGYSALLGVTITPNIFACAIDVSGPTDLAELIEQSPPYWRNYLTLWHQYVGDPYYSEQRIEMDKRSPIYKVEAVTKPILIVHGSNDPRVRQSQADRMVKELRKVGKEVDYLVFENEGHSISKWTNNLTFYRRLEDFLAKHLGGRSNGYDFYELGKLVF